MLHIFPQNQIHLFLHSLTHSCTTSFLSTCLVSNTLIGSRGAKMNILKVGTLNGLETQEIRVTFLNQRYLAFHLGSCSFANVRTQHLPLNFPRTTTTHAHLSASPLAMPCYWHFLQDFFCMTSDIWAPLCQTHVISTTSSTPSCLTHLVITESSYE